MAPSGHKPPPYMLRITRGPDTGRSFLLAQGMMTIGRGPKNGIVLSDRAVSQDHAAIEMTEAGCMLRDAGSRHGTGLNGRRIMRETRLRDGDEITLGVTGISFREAPVAALPNEAPDAAAPPQEQAADAPDMPDDADGEDGPATAELEVRGRPVLSFLLSGAAVIALLGLGAWGVKKIVSAEGVRGNQRDYLESAGSFDLTQPDTGPPQGWSVEGKGYGWSVREADGRKFVEARCFVSIGGQSQGALVRAETVPAAHRTRRLLSGWIRTSAVHGVAAIRVRWTSHAAPGFSFDEFFGVAAGDCEWTQVSQAIYPPAGASSMQVGCAVFGSGAAFDDLALHSLDSLGKAPSRYEVQCPGDVVLCSTRLGVMTVRRRGAAALWNGEATLTRAGLTGFGRQGLARQAGGRPHIDDKTNSVVFGGEMFLPASGAPQPVDYVQRVTPLPDGVRVAYRLMPSESGERLAPGVCFVMSAALAAEPAEVLANGEHEVRSGPFEIDAAEAIAWGRKGGRLVFAYGQPGLLRHQVVAGRHELCYFAGSGPTLAADEAKLTLTITIVPTKPALGQ